MKKSHMDEANLVDLNDNELKELLGYLFQSVKSLDEQKKTDPTIEKLKTELKNYVEENYTDQIKRYRGKLKAARNLAEARGIQWKVSENLK